VFSERLKLLRKERNLTQTEFAKQIRASQNTVSNWEKGNRAPDMDTITVLANFFNCSVDYLLGRSDDRIDDSVLDLVNEIDDDLLERYGNIRDALIAQAVRDKAVTDFEFEAIKKYRALDEHGTKIVDFVIAVEYERCSTAPVVEDHHRKYRSIDLYSMPASAGTGTFLDSDEREPIEIPDIPEYARVTFAVAVSGDSMSPVYENGDYLLVEGRLSVEDGDIGVFVLNGESYVKTFRRVDGEMPWLESVNQMYSPIYIKSYDKIICCGKVIGKL